MGINTRPLLSIYPRIIMAEDNYGFAFVSWRRYRIAVTSMISYRWRYLQQLSPDILSYALYSTAFEVEE